MYQSMLFRFFLRPAFCNVHAVLKGVSLYSASELYVGECNYVKDELIIR